MGVFFFLVASTYFIGLASSVPAPWDFSQDLGILARTSGPWDFKSNLGISPGAFVPPLFPKTLGFQKILSGSADLFPVFPVYKTDRWNSVFQRRSVRRFVTFKVGV